MVSQGLMKARGMVRARVKRRARVTFSKGPRRSLAECWAGDHLVLRAGMRSLRSRMMREIMERVKRTGWMKRVAAVVKVRRKAGRELERCHEVRLVSW